MDDENCEDCIEVRYALVNEKREDIEPIIDVSAALDLLRKEQNNDDTGMDMVIPEAERGQPGNRNGSRKINAAGCHVQKREAPPEALSPVWAAAFHHLH